MAGFWMQQVGRGPGFRSWLGANGSAQGSELDSELGARGLPWGLARLGVWGSAWDSAVFFTEWIFLDGRVLDHTGSGYTKQQLQTRPQTYDHHPDHFASRLTYFLLAFWTLGLGQEILKPFLLADGREYKIENLRIF